MVTVLGAARGVSCSVFGRELATTNAVAFEAVKWAGGTAAVGAIVALVVLFVLAGDPARLGRALLAARTSVAVEAGRPACSRRREVRDRSRRRAPAGSTAGGADPVGAALAVDRDRHLGGVDGLSSGDSRLRARFFSWRCSWSASRCRRLAPSAAFTRRTNSPSRRSSARRMMPRWAPRSCCTLLTIGPNLLLGLFFAAQAGLNIAVMKQLADQPDPGRTV